VLNDHALQQRYAFVGPVAVRFERSEELDTGLFRVRSRTVRHDHDGHDARHEQQGEGRGHEAAYGAAAHVPQGHPPSAAPYAAPYPAAPYPAAPPYPGASPYPAAPPVTGPPPGAAPAPSPYAPTAYAPPVAPRETAVLEVDGRRVPLTRAVTVLGRAGEVDVPLDDAGVSRRHAEVHAVDGRYRVVDLGSTNGTFVDGERVATGELRDGSTITVGRSRLVFRLGNR
jgi:hypothetical protein